MNLEKSKGHFPDEPRNPHCFVHTPVQLPKTTDADRATAYEMGGRYVGDTSFLTWAADCVALGRMIGEQDALRQHLVGRVVAVVVREAEEILACIRRIRDYDQLSGGSGSGLLRGELIGGSMDDGSLALCRAHAVSVNDTQGVEVVDMLMLIKPGARVLVRMFKDEPALDAARSAKQEGAS